MRRGRGEGEEEKEAFLSFRSLPFRLSPSPFPPETPDTQATVKKKVNKNTSVKRVTFSL